MIDHIDPMIGIPLAIALSALLWLIERRYARAARREIRRES